MDPCLQGSLLQLSLLIVQCIPVKPKNTLKNNHLKYKYCNLAGSYLVK